MISSIEERYQMEKKFSKYLEERSLMAHRQIGRLQAMVSHYSYNCTDSEKQEIKKFLAEMEAEMLDFAVNYDLNNNK